MPMPSPTPRPIFSGVVGLSEVAVVVAGVGFAAVVVAGGGFGAVVLPRLLEVAVLIVLGVLDGLVELVVEANAVMLK